MNGASLALLWLMQRKRPGKICRKAPVLPLSVTAEFPEQHILFNKFNRISSRAAWHGARMKDGGSLSWEWQGDPVILESRGAQDA
jgi:hypothetical protein